MHLAIDWNSIAQSINWSTVITSGIVAAIVGVFTSASNYLTTRYLSKMLDRIESEVKPKRTKPSVNKRKSTDQSNQTH